MKRNLFFVTIAVIVFMLTSCSEPQEPTVIKNSVDEVAGWGMNYSTLSQVKVHSGTLSSRVDSVNQYSVGYKDFVKNFKVENVSKIRYSAWVLVETVPSSVSLVGALGDGVNKPIAWVGIEVRDKIKNPNEWVRIEGEISVPEEYAENIKFNTYLFSPNKEVAYVDDFEIIVE